MWSNVEVCSEMGAGHIYTPGGVGRKGRRHTYSGALGETSTYASEQVSAFVMHS